MEFGKYGTERPVYIDGKEISITETFVIRQALVAFKERLIDDARGATLEEQFVYGVALKIAEVVQEKLEVK